MRLIRALLLAVALAPTAGAARYWGESQRGWFWYALPPAPAAEEPAEEPPAAPPPIAAEPAPDLSDAPELAEHALLQRRLDNSRIIAVMRPTPANLSRYMYLQREVMERSADFADVWQRVLWADPDLDYALGSRPVNSLAQRTWDAERAEGTARVVAELAGEYGLFFIFGGDCLHCGQLAAVLGRFAEAFAMPVQSVAAAGASHPAFPDAWPDNGFAAASGARSLPAVVLARLDPGRESLVLPIAYGPVTEAELAERIAVIAATPVGERF